MLKNLRKFTRAARYCAEAQADLLTAHAAEARHRAAGALVANAHHALVLVREVRELLELLDGPTRRVPPPFWAVPTRPREVAILDIGDELTAEIGEKRGAEDLLPGARPRTMPSSWLARVARAALTELADRADRAEGLGPDLRARHELAKIADALAEWRHLNPFETVHASPKAAEASEDFWHRMGGMAAPAPACGEPGCKADCPPGCKNGTPDAGRCCT